MKKTFLTAFAVIAACAGGVQAAPLVNEGFNYANGTTLTSTGNWTAFSGAGTLPLTATNGTVTATNLASGASGEDDRITFASPAITTGILYYSTLVTAPTTDTGVTSANGDYFFSAYSTSGGYLARVYLADDTATGSLAFGLTTGTAPTNLGPDITAGTQYKLVLRVDLGTKTATLGVFAANATPTSDSQLTIPSGTAFTSAAGLDSVAIRQGSATGSAFTTVIDGIQVGTTLADVSGITPGSTAAFFNAVPEPSTYAAAIIGFAALALAHRRRRSA